MSNKSIAYFKYHKDLNCWFYVILRCFDKWNDNDPSHINFFAFMI